VPDDPRAWLIAVASRRMTDGWRADAARRRREEAVAAQIPGDERVAPPADREAATEAEEDDTLTLLFMCCHQALSPSSAIALTLRAVSGLTTAEIASAFLVPEATMAQRISRARQSVRAAGAAFAPPGPAEVRERLGSVLQVVYLIVNEGSAVSGGASLQRTDLADEAIRLARMPRALRPDDAEVAGLLALTLLTDARRAARSGPHGELIPLTDQDRALWDRAAITEGTALVTEAFFRGAVGPYQLQAAIAALHDEAASVDATGWPQILALYGVLERVEPSPMVTLNRAVALAMVEGPPAGLALLDTLAGDARVARSHRIDAVRGHLLEMDGDHDAATAAYSAAAGRTTSTAERDHDRGGVADPGGLPHLTGLRSASAPGSPGARFPDPGRGTPRPDRTPGRDGPWPSTTTMCTRSRNCSRGSGSGC